MQAPAKTAQAAQDKAVATAQKTQADVQKVDRQTQLLQAKQKDTGTLSNVDQVKLQHLHEDKAQLSGEPPKPVSDGTVPPVKTSENAPVVSTPSSESKVVQTESQGKSVSSDNSTSKTNTTTTPTSKTDTTPTAKADTSAIKQQIADIKNNDMHYGSDGNLTPAAAKQINVLNKQLNAAGERVAKVDKPVTVTPVEDTSKVSTTPDIGTTKLAQGVEDNAIKRGLTDGFANKPEYAKVKISDQTKAATNLLKTNPEKAVRIAMGHEAPPEGLLPESAFIAVEHQATKTGNVELLRQLAEQSLLKPQAWVSVLECSQNVIQIHPLVGLKKSVMLGLRHLKLRIKGLLQLKLLIKKLIQLRM